MRTPFIFTFLLTDSCPLACAHCCFSAGKSKKSTLSRYQIFNTIKYINISKIKFIAFSGGEPFLLGQTLVDAVHEAKDKGFGTRIVTSGYFGKDKSTTERRLKELQQAGLDEISISWDDFHERFVPFDYIRNVFHESKKLGLAVSINVTQGRNSKWTADRVKIELGLSESNNYPIFDSPLILTGRAHSVMKKTEIYQNRYIGPCHGIMAYPTLRATNKLMACCGAIPETDSLILDHDFKPENLDADLERGQKLALFNLLYILGPSEILKWISKNYEINIKEEKYISGNCEACYMLFNTVDLVDKLLALERACNYLLP